MLSSTVGATNKVMGSTKHEKSFNTFERPYEQNIIGLRGIIYFWIGLMLLIVITFGLMAALLKVLEDESAESADPIHPLMMSERERLPPEPRLQLAPGFGVDDENGRVNLELRPPQAEYREIHKQWQDIWEHGQKDEKSGTMQTMPIDVAKETFLGEGIKTKTGPDAEKILDDSRLYISDSSSGRMATLKRK